MPSGHMCDHLPPTTMTELKTKMALRTHKGWLPKVFFALSSPPLSRYCDFAPFLAGNGVWCYGKVSHVYAIARRSLEQSYRVKWDDGTSMKVPKVFWAPLLFSSIVSSPLLFSFMRISVVHVPSLISRMCSRKLSSHKSLLMLKWRLRWLQKRRLLLWRYT